MRLLRLILFGFAEALLKCIPSYLLGTIFTLIAKALKFSEVRLNLPIKIEKEVFNLNVGIGIEDTSIFPFIVKNNGWEQFEALEVFRLINRESRYTLLDIGANQGLFSLQLLKYLEVKNAPNIDQVFLFEPDKRLLELIKKNIKENFSDGENFKIISKAIAQSGGTLDFFSESENSSRNTLEEGASKYNTSTKNIYQVDCISSADILGELSSMENDTRVIYKSDIQGSDIEVLLNLPSDLVKRIDIGIVELWPKFLKAKNISVDELVQFFSNYGNLRVFDLNGNEVLQENYRRQELFESLEPEKCFNILFSK